MNAIKAKLKRLDARRDKLVAELREYMANQDIPCGCGEMHKVKDCEALQTHWYTPPRGCTEGDYWNRGELQIVCPATGTANRLLSHNDKLREVFESKYRSLFKSVTDTYKDRPAKWWNNQFLDKNREYYDL